MRERPEVIWGLVLVLNRIGLSKGTTVSRWFVTESGAIKEPARLFLVFDLPPRHARQYKLPAVRPTHDFVALVCL